MFPYIPNTDEDVRVMLDRLGISDVDQLFSDIPQALRLTELLSIGAPKSEIEIRKMMHKLAEQNLSGYGTPCFLGAGAYDHTVPSIIPALAQRSEFLTSYTPYQPEISQGTLQVIFEFQTMICQLTGMAVSNASLYDGPSAAAEAAMMSAGINKGSKILISATLNPEVKEVVKTYMRFRSIEVVEIPEKDGHTDLKAMNEMLDAEAVAVLIQSPNFYGVVENLEGVSEAAHKQKAHFIMMQDPISLAILKTPADWGADIAIGEGQPLGNTISFGGPHLGFIGVSKKLMRKLPGRIVGETLDLDGKRAFTLTLQAREQHIRRGKATSNICSNQAINALMATIYMATMGKEGLVEVAGQSAKRAAYLRKQLLATGKVKAGNDHPFFREFVVELPKPAKEVNQLLLENGLIGGYALTGDKENQMILCATEKRTKDEMDHLVRVMEAIL
jgi:glycine dehydrogenase subunit 1